VSHSTLSGSGPDQQSRSGSRTAPLVEPRGSSSERLGDLARHDVVDIPQWCRPLDPSIEVGQDAR